MSRILALCFAVLFGSLAVFSQQAAADPDVIHYRDDIVYGKAGDGLPKEIKAKGTIVAAAPAGVRCGNFATGGTLKIKLSERLSGYPHEFIYVAVLCFVSQKAEDFVGKLVELEVEKMTKPPYSFPVSWATLDSKGTPYYLAKVEGGALVS